MGWVSGSGYRKVLRATVGVGDLFRGGFNQYVIVKFSIESCCCCGCAGAGAGAAVIVTSTQAAVRV